jgi:CCR4-NOT transcription complex subunit 9
MPTHPSPAPAPTGGMQIPRPHGDEESKIYTWIMELVQGDRRETALLELSKKREQVDDLAVILWHSVGTRLPRPSNAAHRLTRLR